MKIKFTFREQLKAGFLFTLMFFSCSVFAQWQINEGFESGVIPSDWTIYDENGDNEQWMTWQHSYAHTGDWLAMVQCYGNDGDDWLITPQVTISSGDVFTFFARAWYGSEDMQVKLSVTGTSINDFDVMLDNVTGLGSTYQEFTYDLSAYAGQSIYLAIRWIQDSYSLVIDDVKVGQPQGNDVGVFSIESPGAFHRTGTDIIPGGIIQNYGATALSTDFDVTCKVENYQNTVVYEQTILFTEDLAAGAADTAFFPQWTPSVAGDYTVTMYTSLPGDGDSSNDTLTSATEIVEHFGTGGPDEMGYYWIDSSEPTGPVYNWIEISTTGTSAIMYGVPSFSGDDNFSEPIPIGFDFPFYGQDRDSVYIDTNGELLLTENQWYTPYPDEGWNNDGNIFNYYTAIPGYTEMPALISAYWDDLEAVSGVSDVYFQTFGTSPDQYCVIQWNNFRFASGNNGTPTLTFEVILYENGDIVMQYKSVDNGQSGGLIPHVSGQSATVAIQNDQANAGLTYLFEVVQNNQYIGPEPAGNLLEDNLAIKFYPGEDLQSPIITHEQIWNTFETTAQLSATITDISGILYDTLYYNTGGDWMAMSHTAYTAPNIYTYDLSGLPQGCTLTYYFAAVDNSPANNRAVYNQENGDNLSFQTLPTAGVEVLLAMPGNRPGFQDYNNTEYPAFVQALNAAGVTFDVFNWAAFDSYTIPDTYNTIFAYANNTNSNDIHDTLSLKLINFLDNGTEDNPKNIFVASDNMASSQHALANGRPFKKFFTAYLRGGYSVMPNGLAGPDSIGYYSGSINGMENSPVGTAGVEVPVYANGPDEIYNRDCPSWYADEVTNPEISSWGSYTFEDGPFNGQAYSYEGGCAIWLDNLIYKSYFISFDISQITSDADRNNMIQEALNWFSTQTYTVTLTASPEEGGTVTGAGEYTIQSTVVVTATPATGYQFVQWSENGTFVSADEEYSFVISSDRSLTAEFELISYSVDLSANPEEAGTYTGEGNYYYGETDTIEAIPEAGYDFVNWTEDGEVFATESLYAFTVEHDYDLVANFEQHIYTIEASADPEEGGSVDGAGEFTYNQTAVLTATAEEGYNFVNWTENEIVAGADPELQVVVTEDHSYVAHFASQSFDVTTSVDPEGTGTTSGDGTYFYYEQVTVSAECNTGYEFVEWLEDGVSVSTDQEYTFFITENRDLVAHLQLQTFTVLIAVNPSAGGTAYGEGDYLYNETATLQAVPETNYEFVNWTESDEVLSTEPEFDIIVTEDHWIVANFRLIEGIDNPEGNKNLQIWPNPASDVITVQTDAFISDNSVIRIMDLLGKEVKVSYSVINNEDVIVDISHLSSGIYLLLITDGKEHLTGRIEKY